MSRVKWAGLAIVLSILLAAILLVRTRDGSTAAPPRDDTPIRIAERPSIMAIPVSASLASLQQRLNAQVQERLFTVDEARDECIPPQYTQMCVGLSVGRTCRGRTVRVQVTPAIACQIRGYADRGAIQLSGAGSTINLAMPVGVTARVSGQGALGRHIRETVTGSADVRAAIAPSIDPNWTPQVAVSLAYDWRNRIGIDLLGHRISLAPSVDPMIDQALGRIADEAPAALASLDLRERMQRVWAQLAQPIQLSREPASWFRFTPAQVGYSGLQVSGGTASTTIMISGTTATFIGGRPMPGDPGPLPPLQRASAQPGFRLFVPVMADYDLLAAAVEQALRIGRPQAFDIPVLGTSTVTFRDVEIYQTTDRNLAVGITLGLDNGRDWRDIRGTVWLTARPAFDSGSRTLGLAEMRVAADTNSPAADQLVRTVNFGPINSLIRSAVRYDFSDAWVRALARANAALNRELGDGIRMRGAIRSASMVDSSTAPEGYYLGLEAEGVVEIDIGASG